MIHFISRALAQTTPQDPPPLEPVQNLLGGFGQIVAYLIPVAFGIAVLVFFWGVIKYIAASGSEDAKAQGRRVMVGGLIALFVLASVWGIIVFVGKSLNIKQGGTITPPAIDNLTPEE